MLRAKVLPEVLSQIVGDGIDATMCVPLSRVFTRALGGYTPSPVAHYTDVAITDLV